MLSTPITRMSRWLHPQPYVIKARLLDFSFITVLLIIATIPLLGLRGANWLNNSSFVLASAILWLGIAGLWLWISERIKPVSAEVATNKMVNRKRIDFGRTVAIALLLVLFTQLAFYLPLQKSFWRGYDDTSTIISGDQPDLWWTVWDAGYNRPFAFIQAFIALVLSPNTIDGFLWLAIVTHFAKGVLLYGILHELLPRTKLIPLIAAILLIVSPADGWRYFIVAQSGYYFTPFLLMLATWLCIY